MKKIVNIISGIIVGLFPVIIAVALSVFIYLAFPGIVGASVSVLLVLSSGVAGFAIFKKIQHSGLIDFFTVARATPDLDNPEPAGDKSVTRKKQ